MCFHQWRWCQAMMPGRPYFLKSFPKWILHFPITSKKFGRDSHSYKIILEKWPKKKELFFEKFRLSKMSSTNFSKKSNFFRKFFRFSCFIISHPQSLKVSLRNSYAFTKARDFRPKPIDFPRFCSKVDFFRNGLQVWWWVHSINWWWGVCNSKPVSGPRYPPSA